MSRHFCCCIPVRVAVFITSILLLLSSTLVAGASIFVLIETRNGDNNPNIGHLTNEQHTVLIVIAVLFSIIALSSLFGFIGSVIRKRSFVALYATISFIIFLVQSGVDGWILYELFRSDSPVHCPSDNVQTEDCKDVFKNARIAFVVGIALHWLLQLYICIVIKRYVTQLEEEQSYNRTTGYVNTAFTMGPTSSAYYPHQPLDQGQGLLAPKVDYPYSDPQHSHGSHA